MKRGRGLILALPAAFSAVFGLLGAAALEEGREPSWYAKMVESRASTARQYSFDAVIELARKVGEGPREAIASFKVKVAVAPENRYLFWLGDKSDLRYVVASDGHRTWAYLPSDNRYAEFEAIVSRLRADPSRAYLAPLTKQDVDPILWSSFVFPILAKLAPDFATVVDVKWPGPSESESREMPVMTVLSGKPEDVYPRLTELTFDPDTLDVTHLQWSGSVLRNDEPDFALMSAAFSSFEVGQNIPASHFVLFPGDAQRVDTLPLPGIDGSWVEGTPAPEFVVHLDNGRKAANSDVQGRGAVIVFTGPDCEPCVKQMKMLGGLAALRDRGAVVLHAGPGSLEAHWVFRIHFLPSVVVIDKKGMVVRYLPGLRSADEIRSLIDQAVNSDGR